MFVSLSKVLLLVVISTLTLQEKAIATHPNEVTTNQTSFWLEIIRTARQLFKKCAPTPVQGLNRLQPKDNAVVIFADCLGRTGLRAVDRALSRDVIEITDNLVIVKRKNITEMDDRNDKSLSSKSLQTIQDWDRQLTEKFLLFFRTRMLKISFKGLNTAPTVSKARRRDKNSNSFEQMMMFGLVAAGFIVIPLGFQFLAVLGGKALLLAKLALVLSSIQGLKKIATSHVNYGLYSTGQGAPWHYDRKWPYEADHYPSTYYTSAVGSPIISEHHVHSHGDIPISPVYSSLHPRGETSYS